MRTLPVTVALVLLLTSAAIASPLDGRWAFSAEACTNPESNGDIGPSIFEGNKITHFESECTITKIAPIGDEASSSAWRAETACSGEGETWTNDSVFAIERDPEGNPRSLVQIDMNEGWVTIFHACK